MAKKEKAPKAPKAGKGGAGGIRLSSHPRARRDIGMAKSCGGLGTFMLAAWFASRAGMPLSAVVLRGMLRVEYEGGSLEVRAGQAVVTAPGEWVRYGSPEPVRPTQQAAHGDPLTEDLARDLYPGSSGGGQSV